jgi:hypothetical protein
MKCPICNNHHPIYESCFGNSSQTGNLNLPNIEPPSININPLPKFDPYTPSYEPPPINIDPLPKFDPYTPSYEPPPINIDPLPKFDPYTPSYKPPPINIDPLPKFDPYTPSYEPPPINIDPFPKYDPLIPPPSPVYDIDRDLIGWKNEFDNKINLGIGGNGPQLDINPGGFVRDPMDNLLGQIGPLNTLMPPDLPQMPSYGPPQSTPDAWNPGYSPFEPPG